ncbi:hypothetical protein AB0H77_31130 [Streptomyces sp. NPDC050844]|uniref:hypothetical protein n=1 Tax=Streptomyces sp. NPDC050844 TaxID=3155790 RepID=UPI0033CDCD15
MDSADHLYVRSAAAAWLAGRGEQASFEYTRTDGAPLGSVVDVRWRHGALRVHLDRAVAPVWDEDGEPVLGMMVPVDHDTLIRRWYVHRIRLDSVGTVRHVRIGTEAFARPIEWFALDECEMTERGLSTPAVEKIIQARHAPRPSLWSPGNARRVPEQEARAQALLRRLVYARRIESVSLAKQVCGEIEDLTGVEGELQAAVRHARIWLVEQNEERRKLFDNLKRAVAEQKPGRVRRLLIRVNATAAEDRTAAESAVYERAIKYFESLNDLTRDAVEAEADTEKEARKAAARVRSALHRLRGYDTYTLDQRPQMEELLRSAASAGELLKRGEARRVEVWKKRAALGPQEQLRVARRYWIQRRFLPSRCGRSRRSVSVKSAPHVLSRSGGRRPTGRAGRRRRGRRPRPGCTTRCHAATGTEWCARDATPDRASCVTTTIASAPARSGSFPTMNACAASCRVTTALTTARSRRAPAADASTRTRCLPRPKPGLLGRAGESGKRRRLRARRGVPGIRRRSLARSARPAQTPRARPTARRCSAA